MSPRFLRILAVSYLVKTLIVGVAWLAIPDLPARATAKAQQVWASFFGGASPR
jgi:hypothetical protein